MSSNADENKSLDKPIQEQADQSTKQMPLNLSKSSSSNQNPPESQTPVSTQTSGFIPISPDVAAQGLMAIGGCRQCSRTFTDRLELIHHFVDHFPTIFYSFEPRKVQPTSSILDPSHQQTPSFLEMHKKPAGELSTSSSSSSDSTPARAVKSPPSLPITVERQPASSMATATATPIISPLAASMFSPLPTPMLPPFRPVEKKKPQPMTQMHPWMAKMAGKTFNRSPNDLPYHMCPYCCQTFLDSATYDDHVNAHKLMFNSAESSMTAANKCNYCDMQFSNVFLLTEHQKLHAQTCTLCHQIFMTVFDLNLHMGTHTGYSYDCKDCGRCYPSRKTLAEHNKTHRMISNDSTESRQDEGDNSGTVSVSLGPNMSPKKIKTEKPSADEKPESLFLSNPYFAKLMHNSPRKRRHRSVRDSTSGTEENLETPKNKRQRGTRPEPRILEVNPTLAYKMPDEKQNEVEVDVETTGSTLNENLEQPQEENKNEMPTPENLMAALLNQLHPKSQAEFMAMLLQQQNR